MIIAFFDFDGTITKKDSFLEFIKYTHGKNNLWKGLFIHSFSVFKYLTKIESGEKLKEKLLTYYYKSYTLEKFNQLGKTFCASKLLQIINHKALEKIYWHQQEGHKVVIVSASINSWISPWANKIGVQLISTEIETVNHVLTGKLKTKNCIGIEKVHRIKEVYNLDDFEFIYAYGNSEGDRELLEIANDKNYKVF